MHTHTISFTDFNDQPRTVELFFNLTEAELTKIQKDYLHVGGVQEVMNQAVKSGDTKQLLDFFEMLVHASYGIKSLDGMTFDKSPDIMHQFEISAYYSDLYMSFFQEDGKVGSDFINAVMPKKLIERAEANVRGEGKLAEAAEAAQAFKPSARNIFDQSRANLQDHQQKQTSEVYTPPVTVQESRPQPQSPSEFEPTLPQPIPTPQPQPSEDADYLAWKAAKEAEQNTGTTNFRVPAEDPDAQHSNISRPPHESQMAHNGGLRP